MANRLLLRSGESASSDVFQRLLGSLAAGIGAISGVGTGFSTGGVGKMNSSWLGVGAPTGHLVVTADGATMNLTITPGWAIVVRDAGASSYDPRGQLVEFDANSSVTILSNGTGSIRNDTIAVRLDQSISPTSDGANACSIVVVQGAAGGGLGNAPADGALYFPLAVVAVAINAVLVTQAQVTDKRVWIPSDINPYKARAYNNANQAAIAASTFTKVVFQVKEFDINGNFDLGNSRFYAAVPGYYYLSGLAAFAGTLNANTRYLAMLYKNGVEIPGTRGAQITSETTSTSPIDVTTSSPPILLAAGDYIELFVWSNFTQALQGTSGDICSLSAHLLSSL